MDEIDESCPTTPVAIITECYVALGALLDEAYKCKDFWDHCSAAVNARNAEFACEEYLRANGVDLAMLQGWVDPGQGV